MPLLLVILDVTNVEAEKDAEWACVRVVYRMVKIPITSTSLNGKLCLLRVHSSVDLLLSKALFSLDPHNLQLHCFLDLHGSIILLFILLSSRPTM